jgi:hypothetical protein
MQHRFFDIVVETENGDVGLDREFTLDIPEHDTSNAMERAEYLGIMMDNLVMASGLSVCSFRSEIVDNFPQVCS